jgi:plastocyanin
MKRTLIILSILLALGGSAGYQIARRRGVAQTPADTPSRVALYDDRSLPDALTVPVGDTVEFVSADHASHSLSLGGGSHGLEKGSAQDSHTHQHVGDFSSGKFESDETWRATFKQPGTYEFHDHLHPQVRVSVIVYTPE